MPGRFRLAARQRFDHADAGKIANAVIRFRYADSQEETLDLVPPENFWSLCGFGRVDYNYERDGFSLPKTPAAQVQLARIARDGLWLETPPGRGVESGDVGNPLAGCGHRLDGRERDEYYIYQEGAVSTASVEIFKHARERSALK